MKVQDLPQDSDQSMIDFELGAGPLKYALDKDNTYTSASSIGWEPEQIALQHVWEDIEQNIQKTKHAVLAGELSPIAYFMELKLMDINILAPYVGKWKWQVKRHLKPKVFNGLNDNTLINYAKAFDVPVLHLKNFKDYYGI